MKKIKIVLLALFCCSTFYLFGDEKGISLQYLPNVSVIQSINVATDQRDLLHEDETETLHTKSCLRKIKILENSSITQLPVEMEVTLLDYHENKPSPLSYPYFGRECIAKLVNIPVRVQVRCDETIEVLEDQESLSKEFYESLSEQFLDGLYCNFELLPLFNLLVGKQLIPGQVLKKESKQGSLPAEITVKKITQDKIYVDIKSSDSSLHISASFMRDNAMVYDISYVIVAEVDDSYLKGTLRMTTNISSKLCE